MEFTAQQIADFLQGEVFGNKEIKVNNFSKIEQGQKGTLTFLSNPKYTHHIYNTKADIVIVDRTFMPEKTVSATLIKVENAYCSISKLFALVESLKPQKSGISTKADIAQSAKLGENVYVGAFTAIGNNTIIGNNVKIYSNVNIGDNVDIKDNTVIYTGVSIYSGCVVGNQNIIHSGAVIGADGFGFAPAEQGHYNKIPQIGNVILGDDVEIGANTTIDRATIGSTIIGNGVKIDNLVQIAHNVEIGDYTAIAAQCGIAGSSKIGKHCVLAGQVGVVGHLTIADRTVLGAQCGVTNNIKENGKVWLGSPIMPIANFRRSAVLLKQLPDLVQKLYKIEKEVSSKD